MARPNVVVICGSSRFIEIMAVCAWIIERDELAITMNLNLLPHWYDPDIPDHLAEHEGCADAMDELHLRKIDLADEIFVVDGIKDGVAYIGESTAREMDYAETRCIPIRRLSEAPTIAMEVVKRYRKWDEARKK